MSKILSKVIVTIEKSIDKLPDPFFLISVLAIGVLILSYISSIAGFSAVHPTTGQEILAVNLLTKQGFQNILINATSNFINFPPLGIVLITVIGIGIAEKSGFFKTSLLIITSSVSKKFISPVLILISVNGSLMGDSGVILLPPLGAMLFASFGRHPIAGLLAAFAAVCGGFSASFLITALDPLLSSFTDVAAKIIDPGYEVFPTANYYFMIVSVFLVTFICWFVTDKIVEPGLKDTNYEKGSESLEVPQGKARKAFYWSLGSVVLATIIIFGLIIPENGLLRDDEGTLRPFFKSIVTLLMLQFALGGIVYGYIAGSIKKSKDIVQMSSDMMNTMGAYIVLVFIIGQFIAYFNDSNLGLIVAVRGAEFLRSLELSKEIMLVFFLMFSMMVNIFISSASAKWALLASIFVPMFMLLGISPESTQMMYRIGDSVTNFISPLFPYFPILLVFAKKFSCDITFGRIISLLLPYSLFLGIAWTLLALIWLLIGIPLGPNAPAFLD